MSRPSAGSDTKPRALVLSPESPYPLHGGGAMRTASLLEYLRSRYEVDLLVFNEEGQPPPIGATGIVTLPRHSRTPASRSARNLRRLLFNRPPLMDRFAGAERHITRCLRGPYELGLIEHFWCAPYIDLLKAHCRRVVLDLHNVESVWLQRTAAVEKGAARLAAARWATRCREMEAELLPRFDAVLVTSAEDAREIAVPSVIYPNALPPSALPQVRPTETIVFSGNLEYHPNLAGISWFARAVWPLLHQCRPNLHWRVVGRNDKQARDMLGGLPGVDVIGPVDDALQAIAESRVAVVPVLSGSGTRFKIIEAWAAGVPVVSTTMGAEGLPARTRENLLIADDAAGFASAVCLILDHPALAAGLRERGRALFESSFTWQAAWQRLDL